MYVFSGSSRNSVSTIPTGDFVSRFTKVEYHPDYAYEEAIRIEYELVGEDGEKYAFSEVFYNTTKNKRTDQFFDYIEEAGVTFLEDGLPDLVGRRENVVLKKRANYHKPVIVERDFITDEETSA